MNIIIPMAGMGKRMRPHTLTTPKPLLPIAGKPIVHRLVEDIVQVCQEPVEEVAFVISPHFGEQVEKDLLAIAGKSGAKGSIYYQEEALGTAHAIYSAAPALKDKVIVAFADTLFKATFTLDDNQDGSIWVQKVKDPSAFGVVKLNENKEITGFVEKPKEPVSDLAIIGIYYFKDGDFLRNELKKLIDDDIKDGGEYQLTRVLESMRAQGTTFVPAAVEEWLDCGNKNATVATNQRYLTYLSEDNLVDSSVVKENALIIPPCYIGKNVKLANSIIGPYVSIGDGTIVSNSRISNAIIRENAQIENANMTNSMIGNHVKINNVPKAYSLGDFSTWENS